MSRQIHYLLAMLIVALLAFDATSLSAQRRGGGGGAARSTARTNVNVNRNTNVNRDVNVNRDIDVHRDVDVNVHHEYGYGPCCYHPVARAAAITTAAVITAAAIGSMVNTIPPSCTVVYANGYTYQQCGNVWYQPQFVGSSTTYVVVAPPR